MALITDITIVEIAKSLFRNKSLVQRLKNKFIAVIRRETPGAINKPKKLVS